MTVQPFNMTIHPLGLMTAFDLTLKGKVEGQAIILKDYAIMLQDRTIMHRGLISKGYTVMYCIRKFLFDPPGWAKLLPFFSSLFYREIKILLS